MKPTPEPEISVVIPQTINKAGNNDVFQVRVCACGAPLVQVAGACARLQKMELWAWARVPAVHANEALCIGASAAFVAQFRMGCGPVVGCGPEIEDTWSIWLASLLC